jgi:hypothetical protein
MIKKQRRSGPLQIDGFKLYGNIYEIYLDYRDKHLFALWDDDPDDYEDDDELMKIMHLWVYGDEEYEDDNDLPDGVDMTHCSISDGYVCRIVGIDDV